MRTLIVEVDADNVVVFSLDEVDESDHVEGCSANKNREDGEDLDSRRTTNRGSVSSRAGASLQTGTELVLWGPDSKK